MLYDEMTAAVQRVSRRLRETADEYRTPLDNLPWRRERTPYRVFLAEMLLVRTRTDVVARLFDSLVSRYPDIRALAHADQGQLANDLEPLGLRKRVPLIQKAAKHIVEQHCGIVPRTVEELISVPGLGLYTATAIAAFAYDSSEVPADVNILRFLSRITGLPMKHPTKGSEDLRALLPHLSRDLDGPESESLLDFTRLVCKPRHPKCEVCPIRDDCAHYRSSVCVTGS